MKNVVVINGHPDRESFNFALTEAFVSGIDQTKWAVTCIHLCDLEFDPILRYGYRKRTEMEPDLVHALEKIKAADHLVWFFPMWWYGLPALMKGFIDRVFLPGIAFQFEGGKPFPKKLFSGKSAHVFITSDTPRWYDWLVMGSPTIKQFKKGTLEFCGIRPVRVTYIAVIKNSTEAFRAKWLEKVKDMAKRA